MMDYPWVGWGSLRLKMGPIFNKFQLTLKVTSLSTLSIVKQLHLNLLSTFQMFRA